jgi:hypothetical protein
MKIIIFFAIICLIIFAYFYYNYKDMTYVKSDIDNKFYLVRSVPDKQQAANVLARLRNNVLTLADYLYKNRDQKEYSEYVQYIDRLHSKANSITIIESTQDSIYTSYSVNKGEQIVFCLRSRKNANMLHDINLMMYVVLHEISHVACPIYDNHGPLFKKIFAFITNAAIKIGLYTKINFGSQPEEYCGLMITDSIV